MDDLVLAVFAVVSVGCLLGFPVYLIFQAVRGWRHGGWRTSKSFDFFLWVVVISGFAVFAYWATTQ
jgi:hypothetical protein